MADLQEIELRRVGWSDDLAEHLARVEMVQPHMSLDYYRHAIEAENLFAFGVFAAGEMVGGTVIGFEDCDLGSEMVCIMAGGHLPGYDLLTSISPAIDGLARAHGCASVRHHTARQGLVMKMAHLGYTASEVVMRKVL